MHLHARPQPPNCKGCALSLINKQSDSHWKATNTCIANAVDWIQNPIDAFRIHMENWVFEYSFLKSKINTFLCGYYLDRRTVVSSSHTGYRYQTFWWHKTIQSGKNFVVTETSVTSDGFMIESTLMHWILLLTSFCIIQNQVFHEQSDGHDRRSKI